MKLKNIKPKILSKPLNKPSYSKVVNLLLELLRFRSITPDDDGALNFIAMLFMEFDSEFMEFDGVTTLILKKKFGDGKHLCFSGHIDVECKMDDLESFKPVVKDDYIYGCGARNMKSAVAAFLTAILEISEFDGTLSIILTSDKFGNHGTKDVLNILNKLNDLPDYAIVAKPTSGEAFGDAINIGKKGSINGTLIIRGIQSYTAYPTKAINPIHILASKFDKFADFKLDSGNEIFEPSKIIITDVKSGNEIYDSTPGEVKVMFNVRNSNLTSKDDIYTYIKSLYGDYDIDLDLNVVAKPFFVSKESKIITKLSQSIEKVCDISPKFSTNGEISDARYFNEFEIEVAEFGVKNDTISPEKVSIDEVENLYNVFKDFIENFNKEKL